jgi:ATP-dependent Clp protease ATP-binding subunit ClpB
MEESLAARVAGQDHVVSAVSDAVWISRAGLEVPNRPVGGVVLVFGSDRGG